MTREEKIEILEKEKAYMLAHGGDRQAEALTSAIKALSQEPSGDMEEIEEIINCDADAETKCKMISNILTAKPHYFENQEPKTGHWIPVSERLPKTDNENTINNYNVLLWVKNKSHPEREPQIYLGKLRHIDGDDGSENFWGIETKPCDWTIWGWCYFNEPEVIAWMPLPEPYEPQESEDI